VATVEDEFQQVLYALQEHLEQLDAQLRMSLSEWTGDAQAAYRAAHAEWRAVADDMASRLGWLHGVIRTARENYCSARTTNMAMWQGRR
jgi:WXG100 family type VII secretion target